MPDDKFPSILPLVMRVAAKSIGNDLESHLPMTESMPVKEKYTDHWGDAVTVYESGFRSTISTSDRLLYGDYGHSFGQGMFVVDKQLKMVFRDDPEYVDLCKKAGTVKKIMDALRDNFKEYSVERGRGDRIVVNDKIIKGFLLYPGCIRKESDEMIQAYIENVTSTIQLDIDRGRIVKGKRGTDE